MLLRHKSSALVLLSLLASLALPAALDADEKVKPQKFKDRYNFRSGRPDDRDDCGTSLFRVVENKQGKSVARGARTFPAYLHQGKARDFGPELYLTYPDLAEGDVAAFFGGIYRVDVVTGSAKKSWMRIERVPADKLPKGLSLTWDSIAVPPGKDELVFTMIHDVKVRVESIDAPAKNGNKATAKLIVESFGKTEVFVGDATVKEGDVVLLRNVGHKVRAVVLPDAKTKVIGWLELSPDPVPEADLVKQKIAFVRPKKREK